MTLTDVQALLTELRLVYVEGTSEFSETVPAGSVISWQVQDNASLVAGAQVLPDTAIVAQRVARTGAAPCARPDEPDRRRGDGDADRAAVGDRSR